MIKTKLNLKNDIIFKAFFSRKGNEEFLVDFLNALLKIEIKQIVIREEVSLQQLSVQEKSGRLDLQAILNDGVIVNIELQIQNERNIKERTTLYSSKVLAREVGKGTRYEDIKQVIMINILDYELLGFEEYISETAIVLDKHREYEVLKGIKWYFIELPKFRKAHPDMDEKINQWLAFIDDYDKEGIKLAEKNNKTLERARFEMNCLTGDAAVQRLAELREKWDMDWNSSMYWAKEDGKEEGIKQGKEENKKEIARKLIKMKLPIEQIMEATELTKEEVERLQQEDNKE